MGFADFMNDHDVGVAQAGGCLGFSAEAGGGGVAGEHAVEDEFEGDIAIEGELAGAIDDSHAAATDFVKQLVVADA
jgi:hypothetical protein